MKCPPVGEVGHSAIALGFSVVLVMACSQVCVLDSCIGADFSGGSIGEYHALIQNGDVFGDGHDDVHVMLDQQDCGFCIERFDQLVEVFDFGFRQALGGFIKNEQARVLGKAHANFQDALVSVAEIAGQLVSAVRDVETLQDLVCFCGHCAFVRAQAAAGREV